MAPSMRGLRLSKNLAVGHDAYIGPFANVPDSPKNSEICVLYCRSDVGIAPYDHKIRTFLTH